MSIHLLQGTCLRIMQSWHIKVCSKQGCASSVTWNLYSLLVQVPGLIWSNKYHKSSHDFISWRRLCLHQEVATAWCYWCSHLSQTHTRRLRGQCFWLVQLGEWIFFFNACERKNSEKITSLMISLSLSPCLNVGCLEYLSIWIFGYLSNLSNSTGEGNSRACWGVTSNPGKSKSRYRKGRPHSTGWDVKLRLVEDMIQWDPISKNARSLYLSLG